MPDTSPWLQIHRWTLSRSLWEAQSSSEFRRHWIENTYHVVDSFKFEDIIDNLKVEEVDDFAELFLAVYMGVDATREFLSVR
ncbi:hypothetical protein F5Y17DRAFT_455884 [Xylariaceae sp. FL0594]|nr:hypothetical protein F5Y17DRAFT_455884 [Xylariaceae sp. FL0594]